MALSGAVSVEVTMRADAAGAPQFWVNRWEISQVANGTFSNVEVVAAAFGLFHRNVLQDNFWVDSVRLSTYVPDSAPYNPDSLYVLPINARGTLASGTPTALVLPLTNVLHVRKLVPTGRLGHLFLRGYLREDDIQSDTYSGSVSLSNPSAVQSQVAAEYVRLTGSLPTGTSIALVSGDGLVLQSRDVSSLVVAGVGYRSFRTRRKTRLVTNAVSELSNILQDGVVGLGEIPALVQAIGTVVRSIGGNLPPLLP